MVDGVGFEPTTRGFIWPVVWIQTGVLPVKLTARHSTRRANDYRGFSLWKKLFEIKVRAVTSSRIAGAKRLFRRLQDEPQEFNTHAGDPWALWKGVGGPRDSGKASILEIGH